MSLQRDMYEGEVPNYASTSFPPPRAFQAVAMESVKEGRREGHKNQLIMAPTGAGKSYLGLWLAQQTLAKGNRAIFVCDRTTLINQTSETADRYGLTQHGIIQADNPRTNPRWPFQIASAQTLMNRGWPEADVIIIDEAHTQLSVWTRHIMRTHATVIGLSATPFSKGLGGLFTNLINAATMNQLTKEKVLVPLSVMSGVKPNMVGAMTINGEWSPDAAEERGMEIIGDVVTEWVKHGENRKTFCFGSTVTHCEEMCNQFVKAGIMAALFTGHTPEAERKDIFEEFDDLDGPLRILVTVEALAKGVDKPYVSCIIDARPLRKSLSTFIQIVGRGLRSSPETGKTDCILLDHSGNITRFREDYIEVFFNGLDKLDDADRLDSKVRKDEPEESGKPEPKCPACGFKPFFKRCMGCGYEIVTPPKTEHQPGEMQSVTLGKGKVIDKQDLYQQCVAYARANSSEKTQQGRAAHLYRDMTGDWPPRAWSFDRQPVVPISKEVLNKVRSLNIRRAKTLEKEAA